MELFARFMIVVAVVQLVYAAGLLGACWVQGMPVTKVEIFQWGPKIGKWKVQGIELELGTIPFSIAVQVAGMGPDEADLPNGFTQRTRLGRAAVHLSSVAAILIVGVLICGWPGSMTILLSGMREIAMGAFAPLSLGRAFVLRFFDLLAGGGVLIAVGVLCLKYAALCLLPVPHQNAVSALVELLTSSESRARVVTWVTIGGGLVFLSIAVSWSAAIIAAIIQRTSGREPSTVIVGGATLGAFLLMIWLGESGPGKEKRAT